MWSDPFDDDGRSHAARGAHRDEAVAATRALEFVEHGADEHGASGGDGVAESHGAAVHVDLLAIEVEVAATEHPLATNTTSDGRKIILSKSGNDRAIGGSSSGAICAFTAAWERPDAFTRVFSVVGTYVGLRGGDRYPTLIRKFEPLPLRVFLQDGANYQNIYAGDWWMANQEMERALVWAGYDVRHTWGDGGHNGQQATAVFPDALRWLWRDYPRPDDARDTSNRGLLGVEPAAQANPR